MRQVFEQISRGRLHKHHGAHSRRVWHRQGTDSLTRSTTARRGPRNPLSRSAAPPCPIRSSSPSCLATRRAPSPEPPLARRADSSWLMAARCFSTRLAISICRRRSSCCGCSRTASSSGSEAPNRSRPTCVWSPPPTATSKKPSRPGPSARICHYRLNVFTIFVPPLRERRTDILLLADHFLEKYAIEHGKNIKRISTPAIDMLMAYSLAGQRARAAEHHRACGPRLRLQRPCTGITFRPRSRPARRQAP